MRPAQTIKLMEAAFDKGKLEALRDIQVDLHNASVLTAGGEDAVLVSDIDAVIEDAIKELS